MGTVRGKGAGSDAHTREGERGRGREGRGTRGRGRAGRGTCERGGANAKRAGGKGRVVRGQGRSPDGALGAPAREGRVPGGTGPTRGRAWAGKGQARMSMVWHAATSHAPKRKNDHNYMVPHHDTYWAALRLTAWIKRDAAL